MNDESSFGQLDQRLRQGDQEAVAEVVQRFTKRLIGLARGRLDLQIRQKIDAEDVLQSVYRSFFARQAGGQFRLDDWDSLWAILAVITVRKCGRQIDYFQAQRRNIRREVRETSESTNSALPGWEAMAREPTPAEAAALSETVEVLLRDLKEEDREMVTLRLQGYTLEEIAGKCRRTERTVRRVLGRVRQRLERIANDEAGPT